MNLWSKLGALFARKRLEREMAEEMQAHLDELAGRNVAKGMTSEEARYAARREFGGVEQIKERARDERHFVWLEQGWQDVKYAVRALRRAPAFTITAMLTLAFGIGVNAALFTLYNTIALKSLAVKEPDRLVRIAGRTAKGKINGGYNYAEYAAYRDGNHTLDGLLAFAERGWTLQREGEGPVEPGINGDGLNTVTAVLVSENYFEVLGEVVQFGRGFRPEEFRTAAPVMVLSHAFWQAQLQGDPNVIGRTLRLNSQLYTVIGVAPTGFTGERPSAPAGWLPYGQWSPRPEDFTATGAPVFGLIGRLRPGATLAQVKGDLDGIAVKWAADFPGEAAKTSVYLRAGLPFAELELNPKGLIALGTMFFGFALVLVIACTNVANLLFARGISRQKEIGVRLALGASRGRIIRQLLTENGLLCLGGAVIGLALGITTLQVIMTKVIAPHLTAGLALELNLRPDWRVVSFTGLLTVGATLAAGLLPALHTSRANFGAALHADGAAWGRGLTPARLRQLLLIVQVAVCLMLLSCAGVLARSILNLKINDRGFEARGLFGVGLTPNAAIPDRSAALRQALATVKALPGVAGAGMVSPSLLEDPYGLKTRIQAVGTALGGTEQEVHTSFITGGFFDALGVSLRRGRTFREIEQQSTARVIIVSESLARHLWPGQDAVGKTLAVNAEVLHRDRRVSPEATRTFRECEVIGVAPDVITQMGDGAQRAVVYQPVALDAPAYAEVLVRPQFDSASARLELVRAAKAAGVGLQFGRPLSAKLEQLELVYVGFAALSGALGALALTMASVGLYGLMTFAVNQRVREIGVRMALGATTGNVVGLFVRQSMRLVSIGLGLGLVGAGVFALFLEKALFGFKGAFDPMAFGVVTLLFGAIALFACWLPARRAAKVDPMVALRAE